MMDFVVVGNIVYVGNFVGCIVVIDLNLGDCDWIVFEGMCG